MSDERLYINKIAFDYTVKVLDVIIKTIESGKYDKHEVLSFLTMVRDQEQGKIAVNEAKKIINEL